MSFPAIDIISIGNELLEGKTLNTNAAYFGQRLSELGWCARRTVVVRDDVREIVPALENSWSQVDVTLVTGGLGPTHDDVTRESVLQFFGCSQTLDPEALQSLRERYFAHGREVTPENEKQAWIPENSTAILNPEGTAPGFFIDEQNKLLVVLPGVPHECRRMFRDVVLPFLKLRLAPTCDMQKKRICTTGIAESRIFRKLDHMNWLPQEVQVSFLPIVGGVHIDIFGKSEPYREVVSRIRRELRDFTYSESAEPDELQKIEKTWVESARTLPEVIADLLVKHGQRLSIAESCSGGILSDILTGVPGSSRYFKGAVVAYSNEIKTNLLGVSRSTLERFGAVSLPCAREMAAGVRRATGSDIGISTTGIAGPAGGTPWKPVGLVYIGYADPTGCTAKKFVFPDSRLVHKERTARAALTLLWRSLTTRDS